jgi:UDP-N-acetylmuramyl pentapeptide phosphotransferase/UDP-N-acetylglucosamine-1-phosphate transferase
MEADYVDDYDFRRFLFMIFPPYLFYVVILVISVLAELAYFRVADRYNIIDKPNQRSSHSRITLRGGGIVFYFGILLYFLFQGFQYPWFFMGLTLIASISFADDIRPQPAKVRLTIHFLAMLLMFYQWGLFFDPWYFTLFALIVCTGILNAWNFMDGINGITGGYSTVVIVFLWYINTFKVTFVDNNMIYILLLALLIYNFFNFRTKAKCFAGDVGSISIAFIIVFLLGLLIVKMNDLSFLILLAVYGVDTILTIIHRLILRENIFEAHRKHAYQIMANELKIPHVRVSAFYMLIQALVTTGFLVAHPYFHWYYITVVLLLLGTSYLMFMKKYFRLHEQKIAHV